MPLVILCWGNKLHYQFMEMINESLERTKQETISQYKKKCFTYLNGSSNWIPSSSIPSKKNEMIIVAGIMNQWFQV